MVCDACTSSGVSLFSAHVNAASVLTPAFGARSSREHPQEDADSAETRMALSELEMEIVDLRKELGALTLAWLRARLRLRGEAGQRGAGPQGARQRARGLGVRGQAAHRPLCVRRSRHHKKRAGRGGAGQHILGHERPR